jgi:predicted transcriptional regulator
MRIDAPSRTKPDHVAAVQKFIDEQAKMGGLDHEDYLGVQVGSEKEAHLTRTNLSGILEELREARAELARIQTDAQAMLDVLDRGKTYVERVKAEREALREACQAVADWWHRDGISGNKDTDEVATMCRRAIAGLKENS